MASNVQPTVAGAEMKTRDGSKIVYDIYGDAASNKRVTLVHSLAMDRHFWRPVAQLLAADAAVLVHDCRGHGQSDKPAGPYTAEQFGDDVNDLVQHVGWDKTIVGGASMGGCVALAFAIRHPARTSGLGLFDTTACYGDAKAWAERGDAALNNGLASLTNFQVTRWSGDEFREANPDVVKAALDTFLANDLAAYKETCLMLGSADLREHLGEIKVPTRILVGEEDYATPPAMSEVMHKGIAGSTYMVLAKARHLTPLEFPDKIASEIRELLAA